jgi:hypothetical protein
MSSEIERRYRRLLRIYPRSYRLRRGEEMIATLLEGAAPGQTRPSRAERVDLYSGAAREWLGIHALRGLDGGLRLVAPVLLTLAAGCALSGLVLGDDAVIGQRGVTGVVVSAVWTLAVLVRAVIPKASLAAVALAWLTTVTIGSIIAVTGRSTLASRGMTLGFPDGLAVVATAGLVALIAVGTATSRPSIVERVTVPIGVAGLVGAAALVVALNPGTDHTQPAWVRLLWTLPLAAFLAGLAVRARTGSTRWLWAAALLLPLISGHMLLVYVVLTSYGPPLSTVYGEWGAAFGLTPVLGALVAVIIGLAVVASSRGPAASFQVAGSLSLGTAAGLCLYLLANAAYHGDVAHAGLWGYLPAALLATIALFTPRILGRVLAVLALGCVAGTVFVGLGPGTTLDYGTPGALIVLLLVAAAARTGGRRTGVAAMVGAFLLAAATSTVAYGVPLPWSVEVVRATVLPGVASAVLVPMVFWSGRRLLRAETGWGAAIIAFTGSVLWLALLIGPAYGPLGVVVEVCALVLALLAGRMVRQRTVQARPIGADSPATGS